MLEAIRVPTLILHAEDDPFIVITEPSRRAFAANPAIQFVTLPHGGHGPPHFLTLQAEAALRAVKGVF